MDDQRKLKVIQADLRNDTRFARAMRRKRSPFRDRYPRTASVSKYLGIAVLAATAVTGPIMFFKNFSSDPSDALASEGAALSTQQAAPTSISLQEARNRAIQNVLNDPTKRFVLGLCDPILRDEAAKATGDETGEHPTLIELNDALHQPGSDTVPCNPTTEQTIEPINGVKLVLTRTDFLPRTITE